MVGPVLFLLLVSQLALLYFRVLISNSVRSIQRKVSTMSAFSDSVAALESAAASVVPASAAAVSLIASEVDPALVSRVQAVTASLTAIASNLNSAVASAGTPAPAPTT